MSSNCNSFGLKDQAALVTGALLRHFTKRVPSVGDLQFYHMI
jgi:hypothetical protein